MAGRREEVEREHVDEAETRCSVAHLMVDSASGLVDTAVARDMCQVQRSALASLQIANEKLERFNNESVAEFEQLSRAQKKQRETLKRLIKTMGQISRRVAILNHRIENHVRARNLDDPMV